MKHTPGSWYVAERAMWHCDVRFVRTSEDKSGVVGVTSDSNAHLIAAAPELLSVLQDLSEVCGEATCLQAANLEVPNSVWRHMIALNAVAVQVIKKAKGESCSPCFPSIDRPSGQN